MKQHGAVLSTSGKDRDRTTWIVRSIVLSQGGEIVWDVGIVCGESFMTNTCMHVHPIDKRDGSCAIMIRGKVIKEVVWGVTGLLVTSRFHQCTAAVATLCPPH